jgi:hypothetical protein
MSRRRKAHLVALTITCFVVALATGYAEGSNRTSTSVPRNLRPLVREFGTRCRSLGGGCGAAPTLMNYLSHLKKKPKNFGKFKALYIAVTATCNVLRPSLGDGALKGYELEWKNTNELGGKTWVHLTSLSCYWGLRHVTDRGPGVTVGIDLPDRGYLMPRQQCLISDSVCTPIRGGKKFFEPYDDVGKYGERVIATISGFVTINRAAKTQAAFDKHAKDDTAMLNQIAHRLGVPTT